MSPKPGARPHGQIRRSQLITTFGPGAIVDLRDRDSYMVLGLQRWPPGHPLYLWQLPPIPQRVQQLGHLRLP